MFKSCKIQHESLSPQDAQDRKKVSHRVIGTTVLLRGVAMVVLPGPAFVVVPIGLGILATEFMWAGNLLKRVKRHIENKTRK
jgi:tellurite resistance protein TerC